MKLFTKISLLVAAIAGGVGILAVIIGLAMGANVYDLNDMGIYLGPDQQVVVSGVIVEEIEDYLPAEGVIAEHHKEEGHNYSEKQGHHVTEFQYNDELYDYICSMQDIERLKIDVQNAEITIFAVDNAASLYYFSSVERDISKVSGSTLKLEDNSSIQNKIELELYIPVGMLKEIEIEAVNGTISAEKIVADNVTIEIDNASVQIDELIVEDRAELQINAGQMIVGYYEGNDLETECAMGSILVVCEGSRSDYNFDLECGMGKIQIDEDSYSGIGEDIHKNHGSKKSIKAECAMGEIILEFPNSL